MLTRSLYVLIVTAAGCGGGAEPGHAGADASPDGSSTVRVLADHTPSCASGVQGSIGAKYSPTSGVPGLSVLQGLEVSGSDPAGTYAVAEVTLGADAPVFVHTASGRDAVDRVQANTLLETTGGYNTVIVFGGPVLAFQNYPDGLGLTAEATEVTLFPPDGRQLTNPPACTDRAGLVDGSSATIDELADVSGATPTDQSVSIELEVEGGVGGPAHKLRVFHRGAHLFERQGGTVVTIAPSALVGRQLRVRHSQTVLLFDRLAAIAGEIEAL
jgi:hypothetical protein